MSEAKNEDGASGEPQVRSMRLLDALVGSWERRLAAIQEADLDRTGDLIRMGNTEALSHCITELRAQMASASNKQDQGSAPEQPSEESRI